MTTKRPVSHGPNLALGLRLLLEAAEQAPGYTRSGRGIARARQVEAVGAASEWIRALPEAVAALPDPALANVLSLQGIYRRAHRDAVARARRTPAAIDKAPLVAAGAVYEAIDLQLTALLAASAKEASSHLECERIDVAAEHVKRVFSINVTVGSGGRGGKQSTVINQATRAAQEAACLFADYFGETEPGFDPDAFFRACCLPETFVESMAKRRQQAERKAVGQAWRTASRMVKAGSAAKKGPKL